MLCQLSYGRRDGDCLAETLVGFKARTPDYCAAGPEGAGASGLGKTARDSASA